MSADPAHSLADAFGVPLGDAPTKIENGLHGVQIDAQRGFEESWQHIRGYLTGLLAHGGIDAINAEELVVVPGAEEIVALLRLQEYASSGEFDVIVVDCAPTAETLRLLVLPSALSWYFQRLYPRHRSLMRTMAPFLGSEIAANLPGDDVLDAVESLHTRLATVHSLLNDPEIASVRLVLTPEAVVLAEARRTFTSLALYGFAVDGVIANRLVPDGGDDEWRSAWAARQRVQLAQARDSFGDLTMHTAPYLPGEPIGADALADFAAALYDDADPLAAIPVRHGIEVVSGTDGRHELRLPLPLAERDEMDLSRTGDELVVTVSGRRRLIALPTTLRRCAVVGAALADGRLTVQFWDKSQQKEG